MRSISKLLLAAALALWTGLAPAADNILIAQPNGVNAIISSSGTGSPVVQKLNVSCSNCATTSGITIGTTTITGGTTARILYDNAGVVGEYTLSGSGTVVAMQTSPSFITPTLGVASGTSLGLGGATIGSNALAVAGTANISGAVTANGTVIGVAGSYNTVIPSSSTQALELVGGGGGAGSGLIDLAYNSQGVAVIRMGNATSPYFWTLSSTGIINHIQTGGYFLSNPATATMQLGAADVASGAVAQTLQPQGNTGNATTGPLFTIKGAGGGSGASVGGELRLQGGTPSAGTGGAITFYTSATTTPALVLTMAANGQSTFAQAVVFANDVTLSGVGKYINLPNTGGIFWASRSAIQSSADGSITLTNNNATSFTSLLFGGTTSSFPALKRSSATLITRLADDSADATHQVGQIIVSGIATDAAHTDSTVCQDTTTHQFYAGSGALGVCLGTSGRQFKTAFAPMAAGIDDLMKINFINYRYLNGYGDNGARTQYGTTAQDVEAAIPDLARHDAKGDTINYDSGALLFIGLRAIQQLKADNDNLRTEINTLKQARR